MGPNLSSMTVFVFLILCLIWGSTWMAIKIGIADAPPMYTAGVRFVLAVMVLGSIAFARGYRYPRKVSELVKLGYPGLYMFGLSYGFVYMAEGYIDSSLTAVLFGSFPFFVALLSSLRLDVPKIDYRGWLGLVVGFSGVLLISYVQWEASADLFFGSGLALAGSFVAAWGLIVHKRDYSEVNLVVATSVQMAAGGLPLLLLALLTEDFAQFDFSVVAIGSIVYLALFGSVAAFLMYFWLLRKTTVLVVSLIAFVTPLVAIVLGQLFMEEVLSWRVAVGTVLILSGILGVINPRPSAKTAPTRQ